MKMHTWLEFADIEQRWDYREIRKQECENTRFEKLGGAARRFEVDEYRE